MKHSHIVFAAIVALVWLADASESIAAQNPATAVPGIAGITAAAVAGISQPGAVKKAVHKKRAAQRKPEVAHKPKPYVAKDPVRFPEPRMAGGAPTSVVDIKASTVLGGMDKAYRNLNTFTATLDARGSDNSGLPTIHATIGCSRHPERAFANVTLPTPGTYIFDGTHIVIFPAPDPGHFTMIENAWSHLAGSGIGTVFGRLLDNPRYEILARIVTSGFATQVDLGNFDKLVALEPAVVEDVMCDRVQALDEAGTVTLCVARKDHLLRRVTWVTNLDGGKTSYFIENFSNVTVNPDLPATAFIFSPPPGITLYVK